MYSGACGNGLPSTIALPFASMGSSGVHRPEPHGGMTSWSSSISVSVQLRPRRDVEPVRDQELTVHVEAHADALVGVDELDEVATATDGRELLIVDLVVEDRAVQANAIAELGLDATSMESIVSDFATEGWPKNAMSRP
jgi:hypothetical protein